MSQLRIHLFGGLALFWGDQPLPPIPAAAARALFAYLVVYRGRPHTRDLLAGTFWPDLPDAVARRRLSQALWQIRRALRQAIVVSLSNHQGDALSPHTVLLTEGDTVQLNPDLPLWLDVDEFGRLVNWEIGRLGTGSQGPTTRPRGVPAQGAYPPKGRTNLQALSEAVELYRGDFLAGYYDDWILVERERLRETFLAMLERLVEGYRSQGVHERALVYARRLATDDPWREEAHREVMRLCHLLGRDAEALKQFEICREILAEELGAEPSPETAALAAEIATRSGLPEPPLLPAAARLAVVPLLEHPDRLPLVGRRSELAELLRQVEGAVEGQGGLTLVYGEAGVGKTRLLVELARNAEWRGVQTAWGRCYELAAPPAYQPLVEALRAGLPALREAALKPLWRAELSRLLPELATGEDLPPPLEPEEERRRLLEAIMRAFGALAASVPHLVLLEDAHWMDPASLEALRYLLPRLTGARLLIVNTVRTEELAGTSADVLIAMENTRLTRRLDLRRLDLAETEELVQRALDLKQPAPRFSARLFAETEGNPFFVIETLQTLAEEGLLYRDGAGGWSTPWDESTEDYAALPLPDGVAQSIARRLDRLPDPLRELLSLAAVIGRGIPFDLWHQASGRAEEALLAAGDELRTRGLLLAADPGTARGADYLFAHDQIRRVAYDRLAAPRCRFYHRRVAEALTTLAPDEPESLAYHWTQAGVWDKAAEYHRQAGDRARVVYANAEAVAHYTQALEALARMPGPADLGREFELRLAQEAVNSLRGERAAQAEELAALGTLADRLNDDQCRARVALRQGEYHVDVSDYPAARHHLKRAVEWAHAVGDRRSEAAALGLLGDIHLRLGDGVGARGQSELALTIYRAIGDRLGEAQSLGACGIACYVAGDLLAAQDYCEQALAVYRMVGDRKGEGLSLYRLGRFSRDLGRLAAAREYVAQALTITCTMGDQYHEAYYRLELGNLYYALGDYAQARETLEQVVRIFHCINEPRGEGASLIDLGLVFHALGDNETAQDYCERGLDLLRAIGDRWTEAGGLNYLGRVLEGQGNLEAAAVAYGQALAVNRETEQPARAIRDLAGLARIALAHGRMANALEQVEEILSWISAHGIAGIDYPPVVYLTVYRVLAAAGEPKRAQGVLTEAYARLMEQADQLGDEDSRRSFLENVAEHRAIVAAYRELKARQQETQRTVRLPRADAPTGRPLRDDEYVEVTWTLATPDDDEIADEIARRRHRLLRLVREAADHSASPSVEHLAEALKAGARTVKRDLSALRAAGHDVRTRGRRGSSDQ